MLADGPTEEVRLPRVGGFEVEGEEVAHRVPDHRATDGGRLGDERSERREGAAAGRAPQIHVVGVEPVLPTVVADPPERVDDIVDLRRKGGLAAEAIAAGHGGEAGARRCGRRTRAPTPASHGAHADGPLSIRRRVRTPQPAAARPWSRSRGRRRARARGIPPALRTRRPCRRRAWAVTVRRC